MNENICCLFFQTGTMDIFCDETYAMNLIEAERRIFASVV